VGVLLLGLEGHKYLEFLIKIKKYLKEKQSHPRKIHKQFWV